MARPAVTVLSLVSRRLIILEFYKSPDCCHISVDYSGLFLMFLNNDRCVTLFEI